MVQYCDADGQYYNTKRGGQAGSTFTVAGSSEAEDNTGLQTKTVWGTVSCKLYNIDNPDDVINLTNGTYKITLVEFN